MNIKQIIYMAAVYERGSLSAAAKDQYVTVQAVSKAIADLERELGRKLFVRESRGVHPTPFGEAFYQKASGVIAGFEGLDRFAGSYQERSCAGDGLRFALNTPEFPGHELVREKTTAFVKSRLGIDVAYCLATGEAAYDGLMEGAYDALVTVGALHRPDVACRPVGTVPAGVMLGRNHPLAAKDVVAVEDMIPYSVGFSSWFDRTNDTIVQSYRDRYPDLRFVDVSLDGLLDFLIQGGLIFTTGIPALGRSHKQMTVRLVAPKDAMPVPICVACRKERCEVVFGVMEKLFAGGSASILGMGEVDPS